MASNLGVDLKLYKVSVQMCLGNDLNEGKFEDGV